MLPGKLLPCACRTTNRLQIINVSARLGMLGVGPREKGLRHCCGQVVGEERDAGWGEFIYNLGFVFTVYVSY